MPDLDPISPDRPAPDDKRRRKQAEKARGAWISFIGRIVAQVVGAVASVVLGIMVLQKYQQPASPTTAAATGAPATTAPAAPRRPGPATIAVLPLANLSGNAAQDYFVEGMAEALTASLAQLEGLRVISRTSTMRYKTSPPPMPEIARALGADLLVEGSVLQAGNDVRITAQLIDGATDEHLWAQSYTRTLKDVIRLQDEVAVAIAAAIQGTVSRRPGPGAALDHVVEAETYDLYLRGRHAWYTRTPASLKMALDYFQQAVDRDPLFALAHVGLADAHALHASPAVSPGAVRQHMDQARASAIRALDLNGSLAEAHTALGGVIFFGDRDLDDAATKFRRAIELNPSYPVAHEWLGLLLSEQGRIDEAIAHADIAVMLDPLEATMYQARGLVLYTGRRFAAAVESLKKSLELTPELPLARVVLVKALTLDGKAGEALTHCESPAATVARPDLAVACIVAATRANRADDAAARRAALEAMRPAPGPALALVDAALGRLAEALQRLERIAARRGLPPELATDPLFDELRRQPQWKALAATMAPRPRPQPPARPSS